MNLARILHWVVMAFFFIVGIYLTGLGGFLVYLGGSFYYVFSGLAAIFISVLLYRGDPNAIRGYGVILLVTVVWAVYESDWYLLALLPRLGFWLGLALWFVTSWYRKSLKIHHVDNLPQRRFWLGRQLFFATLHY